MHIYRVCVQMCTKCEVSMSNLVLHGVCTDTSANTDTQSMIVQGTLVDKPNEPKTQPVKYIKTPPSFPKL